MSKRIVAVSGGFDPVHVGHIRLLKGARKLGDELVVILNSDRFLKKKKGKGFMSWRDRAEIIGSIRYVDRVVATLDRDQTVRKTLAKLKPDIFANGGDRKTKQDIPERHVCEKNGIKMIFGIGGKKVRSSSILLKKYGKR